MTYDGYNIHISEIRCTLFGMQIGQSFAALFLFEKLLGDYPIKRILELGTWYGNLSLYFLLYCLNIDADFRTYDTLNISSKSKLKTLLEFEKYFQQKDIFKSTEEIREFIQREGRTFLFCDNGSKKEEFRLFVPFLKNGDIIGVHDWDSEIFLSDISDIIELYHLEMIFEGECKKYDKKLRFFKKI
ncbi:TPA: hypothetical protein DIU22_05435 [Candidatus Woesebacteria bacterium]|nr:hypothetical protein [Candidatus Woesebacteria bacterium]